MKHGSLFTGIGGFDLAAEWMGWENVFQVEIDKFCQKVLEKNFPNTIRYGDITKTDFTIHRGNIDILTGGFPCQPFSIAGKRKGASDSRFLWHEMLRAIREVQPAYIMAENVYGILNQDRGLVFEQVCSEMENEGYEVQPYLLPACSIGAPHRRERFWFIAYSDSNGKMVQGRNGNSENKKRYDEAKIQERQNEFPGVKQPSNKTSANANVGRQQECWPQWFTSGELTQNYGLASKPGIRRGDDGFSNRVHRIKALGNAIVPQVAFEIFKAIEQTCQK